jgi:hypothetical protein
MFETITMPDIVLRPPKLQALLLCSTKPHAGQDRDRRLGASNPDWENAFARMPPASCTEHCIEERKDPLAGFMCTSYHFLSRSPLTRHDKLLTSLECA